MKVKSESEVAQSCPTLSDPMDCSPLGSSIHGPFQARVLKWGAIRSQKKKVKSIYDPAMSLLGMLLLLLLSRFSRVQLCVTL